MIDCDVRFCVMQREQVFLSQLELHEQLELSEQQQLVMNELLQLELHEQHEVFLRLGCCYESRD